MGQSKKFHKTADGRIMPCTASVRACPMQHFLSVDDAKDNRSRVVPNAPSEDIVVFDISYTVDNLGNVQQDSNDFYTLGQMGSNVEEKLRAVGRRPRFPSGSIVAELGNGRQIVVQRENFLRYGNIPMTRYYVTFWHSDNDYETTSAELKNNAEDIGSYQILQKKIQALFTNTRDKYSMELGEKVNLGTLSPAVRDAHLKKFDTSLSNSYNRILSDIGQIEVMTNGADKALENYGIDVFDHSDPSVMELDVDCAEMSVTSRDLVDSLRIHSSKDKDAKSVVLRLGDVARRDGKITSRWSLVRERDGKWFFSHQSPTTTDVRPINPQSPEDQRMIADVILNSSKDASRKNTLVQNLLRELDPAVSSYEKTVEYRLLNPTPTPLPPVEQISKTSVKSKVFKLFR